MEKPRWEGPFFKSNSVLAETLIESEPGISSSPSPLILLNNKYSYNPINSSFEGLGLSTKGMLFLLLSF
jgi:hypothetical protein